MAFKAIPGLLYNGVQVGYDDGVVVAPTPTPTPVPAPVVATTYPVANLTHDDKLYIYKQITPYSYALRAIPGSHQVFFDILTNNSGKTYWQLVGVGGIDTLASSTLKLQINSAINYAGYSNDLNAFNPATYTGPLKTIYANLLKSKLGQ